MGENGKPSQKEPEENLQEQVEEHKSSNRKKFGTFSGVFTPTLLTILGVIMYLREGWVVGNAGLLGAWTIILISFAITGFTGLSLASITTNIRIGAGGAYSIISQSLGLEVGGSIGIPLYLSQALAVSMYIFGFRAGWLSIFPEHSPLLVDLGTFLILFGIAYISASFAFRIQFVIFAVIIISLISIAVAAFNGTTLQGEITWWGNFPGSPENNYAGTTFWAVFAVFFPASTGIMAGANMSGELKDPRSSIPSGTLAAIGLSLLVYLALAFWLAKSASDQDLVQNYTIMVDLAAWGPAILAGLLGATFSSALSSIVGAPRILQALGDHRILPGGKWFASRSKSGEPHHAMLFTGLIVLGALMLRNLNAVAPLITMFFLITYAMINIVVIIEQGMELLSFRPLFKIPRIVPFIGAAGCLFTMFIVNPVFSLAAFFVVLAIYIYLMRRHLEAPFGDVRSGLFVALAEWSAEKVASLPSSRERTWKANLLVPVEDIRALRGNFSFIRDITYPTGSVKILGVTRPDDQSDRASFLSRLPILMSGFRDEGVFATWTVTEADDFTESVLTGMETLSGVFFRPNTLFLNLPLTENQERDQALQSIIKKAFKIRIGVLLFADHPKARLGRRLNVNLWVEDRSPDWELKMDLGNMDLALLTAYTLKRNWDGSLNLISALEDKDQEDNAREFLDSLIDLSRMPGADIFVTHRGDQIEKPIEKMPQADLNVFSLGENPDFGALRKLVDQTGASCLFAMDSGEENALA